MTTQRDRRFDNQGFFSALDGARQARGLTWKGVADGASVSPSTLTRIAQGRRPDVDSLAALLSWAGLDSRDFILGHLGEEGESLSKISVLLRHDPNLSPQSSEMLDQIVKATYNRLRD